MYLLGLKLVFAYATDGAYPIIGDILKGCSWLDATVGISYCGVIDVTANFANVLHNCKCLVITNGYYSFNNLLRQNVIQTSIVAALTGLIAEDAARAAVEIHLNGVFL